MSDITRTLSQIESGDPAAAEQLLPRDYGEMRKLASSKLAQEKPGLALEATALMHELCVRLVGGEPPPYWNGRTHFFRARGRGDAACFGGQRQAQAKLQSRRRKAPLGRHTADGEALTAMGST